MADKAHALTDKEIAKMERHLVGIYQKAGKDVSAELQRYSESIKGQSDALLKAVDDAKTEREKQAAKAAYIHFYSVVVKRDKEFQKASAAAAERVYKANQDAAKYINTKTANIYAVNYNQIGRGLQSDLDGYSFKPVSEKDAEQYGEIERQTVDKKKDTTWNAKNIRNAVVAGAIMLYGAKKIFGNSASKTVKRNQASANRQASDMMTSAENKGRLDSMYRASDEGFEVKKYWIATLDNRTRETHIEYDSMDPVELDYEYAPGLKQPRDPDCSIDDEVCNCRCRILYNTGRERSATRTAREGEVTGTYREPSSFSGTKTVNVPNMSYREWMKWRSK